MDRNELEMTLDIWADEEARHAAKAKSDGDERMHSIHLMKKSMYRTMLKVIAVKAPARLAATAAEMEERAKKFTANGDHDNAERCLIQKSCIERVIGLLEETGGVR